jgi:hypothetical protein
LEEDGEVGGFGGGGGEEGEADVGEEGEGLAGFYGDLFFVAENQAKQFWQTLPMLNKIPPRKRYTSRRQIIYHFILQRIKVQSIHLHLQTLLQQQKVRLIGFFQLKSLFLRHLKYV